MSNEQPRRYLYLIAFILVCETAGIIGSLFTSQSVMEWYPTLAKPEFNPPSWVFGPVWTLLYALMGISAYLVFMSDGPGKGQAMMVFWAQLIVNTGWSIAFFGMRSPLLGFLVISLLWLMIAYSILRFRRISVRAALLLVPYILWVSFAAILNFSIMILN